MSVREGEIKADDSKTIGFGDVTRGQPRGRFEWTRRTPLMNWTAVVGTVR